MPPLNSAQRATASQFMALTGASEKLATKLLKTAGWKLDQAANSYFEQNGIVPQNSKEADALAKLFENYRGPSDDANMINVEGMMKYFGDLGLDLEGVEILVPVEIIQTPAMGVITKDGFVNGWTGTGADTVPKQKAYIATQMKKLGSDMDLFKRVYKHTFIFSKEKDQKAMPLEAAVVYWGLLFNAPGRAWVTASTNWIQMWIEFLQAKWTKSVNKDMWNQTFEFFRKTLEDETLSFWSEDGAWPGVIDDFVAYVKEKRGDLPDSMETD